MEKEELMEQRKQWTALNYRTYKEAKEHFRWSERWDIFDGTKEHFNIAHECIDRHPKNEIALRIKFDDRSIETYTFDELSRLTSQFANLLERTGIGFGNRVAVFLFPSLEYYTSMFGVYKRGAVFVPCSPLFGPDAIAYRLEDAKVNTIVTTRNKTDLIGSELVKKLNLKFIYADELRGMLEKESDDYEPKNSVDDLCMIQYSSGTTGAPKAMRYTHGAITVASVVMKFAGGLKPDDIYFCPSSPAWGHGIWYGTISPLIFGKPVGTYSGKFDPEVCLEALEEFGVTNMAAISSHYRLIIETGKADKYKLKLRIITYTGEAMPKEVIKQIKDTWGIVPYCQFGTTEVGPITLDYGGFKDWVVKPGSLGKPMIGGVKVGIIDERGNELPPEKIGQIAIWQKDHWERIGDKVYVDEAGYFWYVGRTDDVIIAAGYTIGPVEVEQSIMKHPAVEECAVVGSPDKERGVIVKAFVRLKEGYSSSNQLKKDIQEFVKDKLSKHEYPRELEFIDELPKTPDGKIKRKILKEMEMRRS
jgi:acetyl-CoA synthetase